MIAQKVSTLWIMGGYNGVSMKWLFKQKLELEYGLKKKDHTYYSLYTFIGTYIRYIFLKITMLNLRNKDNKIFINLLISQKSIPKVHTLTQTDPNNNGWTPIHFAVCKVPVYMNIFWLMYKYKKCDNIYIYA